MTQAYRLPVPTWQTIDEAKRAFSSFERIALSEQFRIPYLQPSQGEYVQAYSPEEREKEALQMVMPVAKIDKAKALLEESFAFDSYSGVAMSLTAHSVSRVAS